MDVLPALARSGAVQRFDRRRRVLFRLRRRSPTCGAAITSRIRLIWRSRWVTTSATIECREALALPSNPERAVLLRRIVACKGTARVRCSLRSMANFASEAPTDDSARRDDVGRRASRSATALGRGG